MNILRIALLIGLASHTVALAADPFMPEFRTPPQPKPAAMPSIAVDASGKPIETVEAWQSRREELRAAWTQILGPFPKPVPLNPEVISTEKLDGYTRTRVRYQTDATWKTEAYILAPNDGKPTHPGMVVLHATTPRTIEDPVGLGGRESNHQALHLVQRGYICIVPANYLWGVGEKGYQQSAERVLKEKPWKTGMAKMVWDAMRATDLLLQQPGVDPNRIGTMGHSLGGKEALYHAAFDERIKAAISCEGGVGLSFSNWDADWYLGKKIKSATFGHDHREVMALIAPRALLVIGGEFDGPQSWPYIEATLPVWKLFGAEDRIGLLSHDEGHNFPAPGERRERVYAWLDHWLKD